MHPCLFLLDVLELCTAWMLSFVLLSQKWQILSSPICWTFICYAGCAVIPTMLRAQTSHPLDPLSATEISVAVATVRAAGATPEVVNHSTDCSLEIVYTIIFSLFFEVLN